MMRLAPQLLFLFIASGGCEHYFVSSQPFPNCDNIIKAYNFPDCDNETYYKSLSTQPSRDEMHKLIKDTHRNVLPYTSSSKLDTWDALSKLDTTDCLGKRIQLFYGEKDLAVNPRQGSGKCTYWNREHVWPRSRGVGKTGKDNTDLHHLRPSDCNVNKARGNKTFAECGTVDSDSSCVKPAHPDAATDTATDTKSFLPPEKKRGDVARMILYMDLRYDGDEEGTENLVVSDCPKYGVKGDPSMGYLSQLLQWHLDDPPDEEERTRNDAICTNWQGNRNPFIDFPDLATSYFDDKQPLPKNGAGYNCAGPTTPPPTNPITQPPPTNPPEKRPGLIITGVIDGPLKGLPKAVELHVTADIPDLSIYGVGFANNGRGSDGEDFTFPSKPATAGSFLTIASEVSEFKAYFDKEPDYVSKKISFNGDDAIELFYYGQVIDVYGEVNVAGGEWKYMDGWSYRRSASTPSAVFNKSDWTLSGVNAVDKCVSNSECSSVFPAQTYKPSIPQPTEICSADECTTNPTDEAN